MLTQTEYDVLSYFRDDWCLNYYGLMKFTNKTEVELKPIVKRLRELNYIQFHRGLFNEDGETAGSGWNRTTEGSKAIDDFEAEQEKIEAAITKTDELVDLYFPKVKVSAVDQVDHNTAILAESLLDVQRDEFKRQLNEVVRSAEHVVAEKIIGLIDDLHIGQDKAIDRDMMYKGIKNGIRAAYELDYGYDPAPNYPVKTKFNLGRSAKNVKK